MEWESHGETRTTEIAVVDVDRAPVKSGDVARNGEAEAAAAARTVAGLVEPHEPVEHALASVGRDPSSVVLDNEYGAIRVPTEQRLGRLPRRAEQRS